MVELTRENGQLGPLFAGQHEDKSDKYLKSVPLAYRLRPLDRSEFIGIEDLSKKYPQLRKNVIGSTIFFGPPGCGKTTLAKVLAGNRQFFTFNAVLEGVPALKKLMQSARQCPTPPIIFVDEIHRFNKAQQDSLLPYVESGDFILFGATTELPQIGLNKALLSRVQVINLGKVSDKTMNGILNRAAKKENLNISNEFLKLIVELSGGDARRALGAIEYLQNTDSNDGQIEIEKLREYLLSNARLYDKNQDRHYDVISAFIKSMRGSDPNSAILWLAVMIDGGEDPVFIARRLVIFASEDIGNADPRALMIATSALTGVQNIGMPEARIILAQATTYLASTVKSNASYLSIDKALSYVRERATIEVPTHLRNTHPDKKNYKYPHSFDGHFVKQKYSNVEEKFYCPTEIGQEKFLKCRLSELWD